MSLHFDPLTSLYINTTYIHKTATMIGKLLERLLEVKQYIILILLLVLLVRSNLGLPTVN